MPFDNSSTPSRMPSTDRADQGNSARIMMPRTKDTMPDASTQPQPQIGRSENEKTILMTPVTRNSTATSSVSEIIPSSGLAISEMPTINASTPRSSAHRNPPQPRTWNDWAIWTAPRIANAQPAISVAASVAANGLNSARSPPTMEMTASSASHPQDDFSLPPYAMSAISLPPLLRARRAPNRRIAGAPQDRRS